MNINKETYYRIHVDDKAGALAGLLENLREHNVDLAGLWGFAKGEGRGEIILVPKDANSFDQAASKLNISAEKGSCFHLTDQDRVGLLVETLQKASSAGINLHAVEAVSVGGQVGCYIWSNETDTDELSQIINS